MRSDLLPVHTVTYKRRPRAAGPDDTLMRYGASSLCPKEGHADGRQAGCRACYVCSHTGGCSVREMVSLVRENYRDKLHCPGPKVL